MADFELHLLDVGAIEYGDCVLCVGSNKSVLIDGGKKASSRDTTGRVNGRDISHSPIQEQIEAILGTTNVDLLIVTHCHSDHVGNLPELIENGDITCTHALLADPQFGFGISGDAAEPGPADSMTPAEKLWMALREEPIHSTDRAEVLQFIEDSAAEYEEYVGLVNGLRDALGERCVIYRGPSEEESPGLDALLAEFSSLGLHIFGPTQAQLGNCALFLTGRDQDVVDLQAGLGTGGQVDLVRAYREAVTLMEAEDAEDAGSNGNAVNNQSIVLSIGQGSHRALLTADMQFTKPQVANDIVKEEMSKLQAAILEDVQNNGPFGFVKLSHHGATNGQDLQLLTDLATPLLGISTGTKSSKHPTGPTLTALKDLKDAIDGLRWGRVDMNGRITFRARGDELTLFKQRGRWNDLTAPAARSGDAGPEEEAAPLPPAATQPIQPSVSVEPGVTGNVEVLVRLPYARTRVSVTIEIEPGVDAGGANRPLR
jgi:beta-lactamase superfamily II metal-dependent hydrolase